MASSWNPINFPNLVDGTYAETSCVTTQYNCIAWAANDIRNWWQPGDPNQVVDRTLYWPVAAPPEFTVDALVIAFQTLGYEKSDSGALEEGWEKVAIYAKDPPKATHAARQLSGGHWTSKLGGGVDLAHMNADDVCGPLYGKVVQFLKRPRVKPVTA